MYQQVAARVKILYILFIYLIQLGKHFLGGQAPQKMALKTCPTGVWDKTCPHLTIEQN